MMDHPYHTAASLFPVLRKPFLRGHVLLSTFAIFWLRRCSGSALQRVSCSKSIYRVSAAMQPPHVTEEQNRIAVSSPVQKRCCTPATNHRVLLIISQLLCCCLQSTHGREAINDANACMRKFLHIETVSQHSPSEVPPQNPLHSRAVALTCVQKTSCACATARASSHVRSSRWRMGVGYFGRVRRGLWRLLHGHVLRRVHVRRP